MPGREPVRDPRAAASAVAGVIVVEAGRVPYARALSAQRAAARARIEGRVHRDYLLLLEHEPVLTIGRGGSLSNVTSSAASLARSGIDVVEIERGGDVTYHGPGQLVGYPILDLEAYRKDLHWYLRRLEESLILALASLGLPAFRVKGHSGVWVGEAKGSRIGRDSGAEEAEAWVASGAIRKIASLGVHVSRWVTWHGFALNVTRQALRNFGLIIPCGIQHVQMTSIESEVGGQEEALGEDVVRAVTEGFSRAFGVQTEPPGEDLPPELAGLWEPAADFGPVSCGVKGARGAKDMGGARCMRVAPRPVPTGHSDYGD